MNKKKILVPIAIAVLLLIVIIAIISCVAKSTKDESSKGKLTLDQIDRVPRRPSVLCLSPSFVEMMYRIKCEDHIMAVTDGCDFPSDAKKLPNLGSSINLDWKLVEQLPIDVVMLTPSHTIEHARFAKLGKKVITGKVDSLDAICNTMWAVGQLFNEEDFVEQWMMELDFTLTALKKKASMRDARGDEPQKILFVLGHTPDFSGDIIVSGAKLFYSDVILKAGGVNAYQGAVERGIITFDELVALQPDIIIDLANPTDLLNRAEYESNIHSAWMKKIAETKKFEKTPKVAVFADSGARRPGPRIVELINNVGKLVFE